MSQFTEEWWPQILKNHGLPENLKSNDVALLIDLGEGMSPHDVLRTTEEWHSLQTVRSRMSTLTGELGLREAGHGRVNRKHKGENRTLLTAWAKERLDTLYTAYQHMTPDEGENDCSVPECMSMWSHR